MRSSAGQHRSRLFNAPRCAISSSAASRSNRASGLRRFNAPAHLHEDGFEDPFSFNVLRDPNPHLSFGGTGVHYCLGANLARMTVGVIFDAIADVMPELTALAAPERLRSGWLNGIKHWQVDYMGA